MKKSLSVILKWVPYLFNEEFFKWFDFREWDRLKGVLKK